MRAALRREQEIKVLQDLSGGDDSPALKIALGELANYGRMKDTSRQFHGLIEGALIAMTSLTAVAAAVGAPVLVTTFLAIAATAVTATRTLANPKERWLANAIAWRDIKSAVWRYQITSTRDADAQRELVSTVDTITARDYSEWVRMQRDDTGSAASANAST